MSSKEDREVEQGLYPLVHAWWAGDSSAPACASRDPILQGTDFGGQCPICARWEANYYWPDDAK